MAGHYKLSQKVRLNRVTFLAGEEEQVEKSGVLLVLLSRKNIAAVSGRLLRVESKSASEPSHFFGGWKWGGPGREKWCFVRVTPQEKNRRSKSLVTTS